MNVIHYIGLDVHKKTIGYCIKTADGRIVREGKLQALRSVAQERGRIRRNTRAHFPSASRRLSTNCTDDRFRWGYFRPLIASVPYFDRTNAFSSDADSWSK
jgi:hypothetical protein